MPLRSRILCFLFPLTLSFAAPAALAATAADLEAIPPSNRCRAEMLNLTPLFERRDEGMSLAQALELADRTNGVPVSRRAVQLAFDFPKMPRDALRVYSAWSCHALEHFVVIRPLAEFERDFEECYRKPAWERDKCANVLWNKVHGFSSDRKSRAKPDQMINITAPPPPGSRTEQTR